MRNKFSCNNNTHKQGYKFENSCARVKCPNKPITILKLKYINKISYFCQQCTEYLKDKDPISSLLDDVVVKSKKKRVR